MTIQLLIATMHQDDYSLLDRINLQSEAVVINQCDRESNYIFSVNGHKVTWINTLERGLSRSRNMALKNATADLCVICDDDEVLSDNYPEMINNAYSNLPDADLIVFNVNRIGWNEQERIFIKSGKVRRFKTYGSVHLTFRRERINQKQIVFNTDFGAGSGKYTSAEDAIFCRSCHLNGLKMYTYPGILCSVTCEESTWFKGYDEHYFYDVGAYLSVAFPKTKHIMKWYYPLRVRKITDLTFVNIIRSINCGFIGYKKNLNYYEFMTLGR